LIRQIPKNGNACPYHELPHVVVDKTPCCGCLLLCQRQKMTRDLGAGIRQASNGDFSQSATGLSPINSAMPRTLERPLIIVNIYCNNAQHTQQAYVRGGGAVKSCVRLNWRRVTRSASHLRRPSMSYPDTRLPHLLPNLPTSSRNPTSCSMFDDTLRKHLREGAMSLPLLEL